jgi:hypothetical protein
MKTFHKLLAAVILLLAVTVGQAADVTVFAASNLTDRLAQTGLLVSKGDYYLSDCLERRCSAHYWKPAPSPKNLCPWLSV